MERDSTKTLFGNYTPTYLAEMAEWSPEKRAAWLADLKKGGDAKTPRTLVRNVLAEALEGLGGTRYVMWFATQEPANARVFMQLVGKMMPTELTGAGGSPLSIVIRHAVDDDPRALHGARDIEGVILDGHFVANPDAADAKEPAALAVATS